MENELPPYERRYRRVYAAGVPFYSPKGYDEDYERFLHNQPARGRLIEFGCGEGHAAHLAAHLDYDVLALDSAPSAIAKAQETWGPCHHGNLAYQVADVVEFRDAPTDTFHIAANLGCLHVIADDGDALRHLRRAFALLRPGGLAFYQNLICLDDALARFPEMTGIIENWREGARKPQPTRTETFLVNGQPVQVEIERVPTATHRTLQSQVTLFEQAGFLIRTARVKTPGLNSAFEAVIIAEKPV